MTTPRLESEDASERWSDVRIDAWVLCAEFVQRIMSEARAGAAKDLPGDIPDVDWAPIWRAGEGAPSDEAAIGRIVRAASEAARGISRHPPEALSPSLPTHRSNGAAVLGEGSTSEPSRDRRRHCRPRGAARAPGPTRRSPRRAFGGPARPSSGPGRTHASVGGR